MGGKRQKVYNLLFEQYTTNNDTKRKRARAPLLIEMQVEPAGMRKLVWESRRLLGD